MGFVPPLNIGGFQPSPATLAQWVYQIWQYLQENPIATEEQLKEYIGTFITTSPETQAMIGAGVEEYLTENPPTVPVKSVQGKTGAVQLAYNEIVPASNAVPVYKASSTPSTNTLVGQYNLGYRLFVNTATQEIFTISPAGALSLVGRGKFDGTTVDLNTSQGDTTIAEAINEVASNVTSLTSPEQLSYQTMNGFNTNAEHNYVAKIGKLCVFHIVVNPTSTRAPGFREFVIKGLPQPAHDVMFYGFVTSGNNTVTPARMVLGGDDEGSYGIRFHYPFVNTLENGQEVTMAGSYITA